jgi:hypothetical protein
MSARCRFRSIRAAERFRLPLDLGANISVTSAPQAVGLSTGVALDIIGSDGGRRFAPFAVRAISHGCQPIHSWIAQPRHAHRPFAAYCLGHVGLICFEERSSGVIPPGWKQRNPCVRGARRASRRQCADPVLQSDREVKPPWGFNQVGFWSRAVTPGRRDQVVF